MALTKTNKDAPPSALARVILLLFGAAPALASIFFFSRTAHTLNGRWEARSWVPVHAELATAEWHTKVVDQIDTSRPSNARYVGSETGIVLTLVNATYHYVYAGQDYVGHSVTVADDDTRPTIFQVIDQPSDCFREALGRALGAALKRSQPITIYVDPGDPHRAAYTREMGSEWAGNLAAGLAIGGLGMVLVVGGGFQRGTAAAKLFVFLMLAVPATITLWVVIHRTWLITWHDLTGLAESSFVPDPLLPGGVWLACSSYFRYYTFRALALVALDVFGAYVLTGWCCFWIKNRWRATRVADSSNPEKVEVLEGR